MDGSTRILLFKQWHRDLREKTLALCERKPAGTVLDLGCGHGETTKSIKDAVGADFVVGLEIEPTFIAVARKAGVDTVRADLESCLPFRDESFDIVTSSQVLEHLIKPDHHLREIHRLLKSGGYCIVTTMNLSSWQDIGALILGWRPFSMHLGESPFIGNPLSPHSGKRSDDVHGHMRVFPYRPFKEVFGVHHLKLESLVGAGYFPLCGYLSKKASSLDPRHATYLIAKARKLGSHQDPQRTTRVSAC